MAFLYNFFQLKDIRSLTNIPVIVLVDKYDGNEKIAVIEAGTGEYLPWSETSWEVLASYCALIWRYTVYDRRKARTEVVTLLEDVWIDGDLRNVFICGKELQMLRYEFDLFCLLVSYLERTFTYERFFNQVWGIDETPTENSLHSCIRRVRRELESILGCPCTIENMRGVGFCLHLNRKKKAERILCE